MSRHPHLWHIQLDNHSRLSNESHCNSKKRTMRPVHCTAMDAMFQEKRIAPEELLDTTRDCSRSVVVGEMRTRRKIPDEWRFASRFAPSYRRCQREEQVSHVAKNRRYGTSDRCTSSIRTVSSSRLCWCLFALAAAHSFEATKVLFGSPPVSLLFASFLVLGSSNNVAHAFLQRSVASRKVAFGMVLHQEFPPSDADPSDSSESSSGKNGETPIFGGTNGEHSPEPSHFEWQQQYPMVNGNHVVDVKNKINSNNTTMVNGKDNHDNNE